MADAQLPGGAGGQGSTPSGGGKRRNRKKKGGQSSRGGQQQPQQQPHQQPQQQLQQQQLPQQQQQQPHQQQQKQPEGKQQQQQQQQGNYAESASEASTSKAVPPKVMEKKPTEGQSQPQPQGQGYGSAQGQDQGQGGATAAPEKTKAQMKAERRAIQEAQRAAKAAKTGSAPGKKEGEGQLKGKQDSSAPKQKTEGAPRPRQDSQQSAGSASSRRRVPDYVKVDDDKLMKKMNKKLEKQQIPKRTVVQRKVGLFNHLHQYERELSLTEAISFAPGGIHPAILKLGLQYAEGVICGSNARCIALLGALKQVISDYTTPPQKEISRDLDAKIKPYISFLTQCRPLSVSMGNAIKYVKWNINHIPTDTPDAEAKDSLCTSIDDFLRLKIKLAGEAISTNACTKITDGDVILVYTCSSLIRRVLCDAFDQKKKFQVVVVDGRPKLEGKEMLRRLVQHGIKCSYVLINAASYVMKEVTKVFLGAHALLANGCVMSRVGSSQIALVAKSYNVPVLVCCETYKFCERVQSDSFVFNELGDPDDLVNIEKPEAYLMDWRDLKSLSLLNLVYDVTPPELIAMVITELGMVPCTSVPVVLRVKNTETE